MNAAAGQIRAQLAEHGPLSFARFMELALYCPLCGYYETKEDTTGKRGDFFTSVSVGPLLGELLAFQFVTWWKEHAARDPERGTCSLRIMEAGAHDGHLAADILTWLQRRRPEVFERVEYGLVEPSLRRRGWQQKTLAVFSNRTHWVEQPPRIDNPGESVAAPFTIFFSNELLDALPVHRLGWDAKSRRWFEWGVALQGEQFVWTRLALAPAHSSGSDTKGRISCFTDQIPSDLLEILPDGFTTEFSPAAENWWRAAATGLPQGKLLTLDYGLEADEFFAPQRARGTLRAYHRHRLSDDLLANPGEQDLTAHVNFTAIRRAGETAGLTTETETTQSRFLTDIAQRAWRKDSGFGPWTQDHTRQFQTLTHPDHLGRAFRVLVQAR